MTESSDPVTLFVCGDVMTGRGVDQVLPHPSDPTLHERYVTDANGYVELAERENGPIERPVDFAYIWGDALDELERVAPDVRLINLETSVTESDDAWSGKGIHYRMHPQNVPCLTAAEIDCCSLANNHVLDWGYAGLTGTLETLEHAGVHYAGAGRNLKEAQAPAIIDVEDKGRVIVFALGSLTSGIPPRWRATEDGPGVNLIDDMSEQTVHHVRDAVQTVRQPADIVIASIHWGGNWGYEIPQTQRDFAHQLIDEAGVDLIHGHSSHHVKGIEVYEGRPILYGCGDFINDYEGIKGRESYRGDLGLMYFPSIDPSTGKLAHFELTPTQIRRFRVNRASTPDAVWLCDTLNRQGEEFGTQAVLNNDDTLTLHWH